MRLYEIKSQYRAALEALADPEIPPEVVKDTIEGLDGMFEEKAIATAVVWKELEAEADGIEVEEKRLAARKQALRNHATRLKAGLFECMEATGKTRIEGVEAVLQVKANGGKVPVVIDDKDAIPRHLGSMLFVVEKDAIREALEAGQEVPGARLGERGKRLEIK